MKRWLVCSTALAAMLCLSAEAAPPTGGWVMTNSPDFPEFTRVMLKHGKAGWNGVVTSVWYGDQKMQDLRTDGDRILFRISNGNPRLTPEDIVLERAGKGIHIKGKIWYQAFDVSGLPASSKALKALDFKTTALPPKRKVAQRDLAATPPMGWSSWNKFATDISDKTVREIGDALVKSGLRDAGYIYVNIDDGWQGKRDKNGKLEANAHFPDMKGLADYLHARGLKLGIYTSPGPRTCAGYEGSYGHIQDDAKTFAEWGVDYLKYDLCSGEAFYNTADTVYGTYQEMGEALAVLDRPIVYSLCEYGRFDVGSWGRDVGGHLWRTTGDIEDNYQTMATIGFDKNGTPKHTGPNGWNDPDMLEIGNGGMTANEYRTHISLWAMLAAPLILGNDVRTMSAETLSLLTNAEVIAIDQDPDGAQGLPVKKDGKIEIWTKKLKDGTVAVGVFNRDTAERRVTVDWTEIGLPEVAKVRDLWAHADLQPAQNVFSVPAHGVQLLKVWRH
jgi:alpha-galactosidase